MFLKVVPKPARNGRARELLPYEIMPCRFCGVGDAKTPNHGTTAACVAALNGEIARLRSLQPVKGLPLLTDQLVSTRQPEETGLRPRLSLQCDSPGRA